MGTLFVVFVISNLETNCGAKSPKPPNLKR
jgi:hypothetical protein